MFSNKKSFFFVASGLLAMLFILSTPQIILADQKISAEIDQALDYTLSTCLPNGPSHVDRGLLAPLVHFAKTTPSGSALKLDKREGATPAFISFRIDVPLKKLMQYMYDPNLPCYIVMPSSMRMTEWKSVENHPDGFPLLWKMFDNLQEPFFVRGVEREEITPDLNTGAYYGYDLYRSMTILPGPEKAVVSVSRQADKSDVGRKGAVVGDDQNWNYIYSNEEGVSMSGLGWASTYMYNGFTVSVFVETGPTSVQCVIFKWLKAGWSNMNMVKSSHIERGMTRFVSDLKTILESPFLPSYDELLDRRAELGTLENRELRDLLRPYFRTLASADDPILRRDPFSELLADDSYLDAMPRLEMEKILIHEFLRCRLGRTAALGADVCDRYSRLDNPWSAQPLVR
ncbi:MAG: hypothetical protein EOM25_00045 [Deltaproteobacteria bacterium]|nr:hypothetical protein [Deltaproteobacteria bacterium]